MTGRWPWPGDTPLDRARRVALSFRNALYEINPDAAMAIDDQVTEWGELWVVPVVETIDLQELVTIDVAAQHVGLTAKAVYEWVYKDWIEAHKGRDKRLRVRLGEAIELNRNLRVKRANRRRDAA
jgi:hypothetical protein